MRAAPRRRTGCLGAQLSPRRQRPAARRRMGTRDAGAALRLPPRAGRCAGGGRGAAAPLAGWAAPPGRGRLRAGPRQGRGWVGKLGSGAGGQGSRQLPFRMGSGPEAYGKFVSGSWAHAALLKLSDVQLRILCTRTDVYTQEFST